MAPAPDEENALKLIVDKISDNNVSEVKNLLAQHGINANAYDEHSMSLLQHACYKGNREMVQLLLDQGADVNGGKHMYQYSALHFAALSGKTDVCHTLLNHGAKPNVTNSVGRTPAQMAAFVGNHACVAVINNFINKEEVDYYTKPVGQEADAKLPPILAEPLHKFITGANMHPVAIALNLKQQSPLGEHLDRVSNVLELMSEKEMKRGMETNEVMSFKLHYFGCIVKEIGRLKKNLEAQHDEAGRKGDAVEAFVKKMLRVGRGGEALDQKQFLVDSVRAFHARECATFRQMVSTLLRPDAPSPVCIISDAINGQRAFADPDTECWTCGEKGASKKCSKCRYVRYCDRECQRMHWFVHKKLCDRATTSPDAGPKVTQDAVKAAVQSARAQVSSMGLN